MTYLKSIFIIVYFNNIIYYYVLNYLFPHAKLLQHKLLRLVENYAGKLY